MKIAIDAKPLFTQRTGIGRYMYHLLREFSLLDQENDYFLCGGIRSIGKTRLGPAKDVAQYEQLLQRSIVQFKVPFPFRKIIRIASGVYTQAAIRMKGAEIFWGTNYFGLFGKSFKTVITIHAMAHAYYPECMHPVMGRDLRRKLKSHAIKADLILTESEHSKGDIIRFLGVREEKIRVIHNGVSHEFHPLENKGEMEKLRQKYHLPQRFILFVGMIEPRKNIIGLMDAFRRLIRDPGFKHHLVIVGSNGWKTQKIFKAAEDLVRNGRIHFTGYAPEADLPGLYNLADLFVYPSFYEGFGFPVIEAMACGVPVITSNASCLPEIAGDAAVYVIPTQTEELVSAIGTVLGNESLSQHLRQKGIERAKQFSWKTAARETLDAFNAVAQIS